MRDLVKRLRDPPLAERNEGIKIEAANEIERLRAIVQMGVEVRTRQKAYFKNRTKEELIASKLAEAAFDKATKP